MMQTDDVGSETHFKVVVVSDQFESMSLLQVSTLLQMFTCNKCTSSWIGLRPWFLLFL